MVALRVPGGAAAFSRGEIDDYTEFVGIYGAKGLAYIKVNEVAKGRDGLQSPIVKNLHDAALPGILERTGAQDGDLMFFGADKAKVVNDAIGALRLKIGHSEFGKKNGLFEDRWAPLWVVDFPMFEYDDEDNRWTAVHHPFTAPKDGHEDLHGHRPRQAASPRPTTWCSTAGSWAAARCVSTAPTCRPRCSAALEHQPEDSAAKFGFLLDALQVRRAAARWPGLRPGPPDHADDRRRVDPRRDRLPEDPACPGPADPGARRRWTRSSCASCTSACATQMLSRHRKSIALAFIASNA